MVYVQITKVCPSRVAHSVYTLYYEPSPVNVVQFGNATHNCNLALQQIICLYLSQCNSYIMMIVILSNEFMIHGKRIITTEKNIIIAFRDFGEKRFISIVFIIIIVIIGRGCGFI